MAHVIWTDLALTDLQGVINYIASDSPSYAVRVGTRIAQAPRQLVQFPLSGRIVPEFQDNNIRELIYGAYRIIYLVRNLTCYIVAVVHGSRDLPRQFDPKDWDVT